MKGTAIFESQRDALGRCVFPKMESAHRDGWSAPEGVTPRRVAVNLGDVPGTLSSSHLARPYSL